MASEPWSFLSSHGLVLVQIIRQPERTKREIAQAVGLTERTVHLILRDLENRGYLTKTPVGRGATYKVNSETKLQHPTLQDIQIKQFLKWLVEDENQTSEVSKTSET